MALLTDIHYRSSELSMYMTLLTRHMLHTWQCLANILHDPHVQSVWSFVILRKLSLLWQPPLTYCSTLPRQNIADFIVDIKSTAHTRKHKQPRIKDNVTDTRCVQVEITWLEWTILESAAKGSYQVLYLFAQTPGVLCHHQHRFHWQPAIKLSFEVFFSYFSFALIDSECHERYKSK